MSTAAISLGIGAVLGVAISFAWLTAEKAIKRRRTARALAEWDAHVADALRLAENEATR